MTFKKGLLRSLAPLLIVTLLTGCMSKIERSADSGDHVVRFGTMDVNKQYWPIFVREAKEAGITIKAVNFTEYSPVNQALAQNQLDVNLFQHLMYLAQFNLKNNTQLVPIGSTEIIPMGLYYKKGSSVTDIRPGAKITIPNDKSNQGRAINVLVQAGLLVLKKETMIPAPTDIDQAQSRVTVTPVDAAQTVLAWNSGQPAIINNTFLLTGNIDPSSALVRDDPTSEISHPYINVFVTRADNKDNPILLKLVEIWHSPAVLEGVRADSRNSSVEVNQSADDLRTALTRIESQLSE